MSNFNYCPLVWHFCGETNTKKIEKIQERALRFIYNEVPNKWAIVKVGHNKGVVDCKFS
jgi:hypothetical protein